MEQQEDREHIGELFARHGLRSTRQRVAVYEALAASRAHPTADELHHLVQNDAEPLSLATVYNTLEALCEAGLARKLATIAGSCRYDADMSEHIHLRLRESGAIEDVPTDIGRRLLERIPADILHEIEESLSVNIDGLNIQVLGTRNPPQ